MNIEGNITGIYKITSPSGKIYIGSSKNINKRWKDYLKSRCEKQHKLLNSFNKYTPEAHIFEILEECEFELLFERERHWQEFYDVLGKNGLNCFYVNTKDKPQVAGEETRAKISANNKSRPFPENCRKACIITNTGRKHTQEHINKRISKMIGFFQKGNEVLCLTTGKIFKSIPELAKFLGKSSQSVSRCLKKGILQGYCFLNDDLNPKEEYSTKNKRKVLHIPTGEIFKSCADAARAFNINSSTIFNRIKINSSVNEFKYLDTDLPKQRRSCKKAIIHLETGLKFNSMREAEIHFNFNKGYVKNNVKGKNSKFKILE